MARVEAELRVRGESLASFAARIGVRSQDINNWKKRGIPRTKQKVVADALGWSLDRLLTEGGAHARVSTVYEMDTPRDGVAEPRENDGARVLAERASTDWTQSSELPPNGYALIPRRRLDVSPASGQLVLERDERSPLIFDNDWIRRIGLRSCDAVVFEARDDSMEPTIRPGDILLVDLGQRQPRNGLLFVAHYGDELRIRRLFLRYDGSLILRADNAACYPEETVPALDRDRYVHIVGVVLWRGGALG